VVVPRRVEAEVSTTRREREARPWEGPCGCDRYCGDDGDTEGPGVCKGLPRQPQPPLVKFFVVHRDDDWRGKAKP
jgi:hypothetical protein